MLLPEYKKHCLGGNEFDDKKSHINTMNSDNNGNTDNSGNANNNNGDGVTQEQSSTDSNYTYLDNTKEYLEEKLEQLETTVEFLKFECEGLRDNIHIHENITRALDPTRRHERTEEEEKYLEEHLDKYPNMPSYESCKEQLSIKEEDIAIMEETIDDFKMQLNNINQAEESNTEESRSNNNNQENSNNDNNDEDID